MLSRTRFCFWPTLICLLSSLWTLLREVCESLTYSPYADAAKISTRRTFSVRTHVQKHYQWCILMSFISNLENVLQRQAITCTFLAGLWVKTDESLFSVPSVASWDSSVNTYYSNIKDPSHRRAHLGYKNLPFRDTYHTLPQSVPLSSGSLSFSCLTQDVRMSLSIQKLSFPSFYLSLCHFEWSGRFDRR